MVYYVFSLYDLDCLYLYGLAISWVILFVESIIFTFWTLDLRQMESK